MFALKISLLLGILITICDVQCSSDIATQCIEQGKDRAHKPLQVMGQYSANPPLDEQFYKKTCFHIHNLGEGCGIIQRAAEVLYSVSPAQLDKLNEQLTLSSHELYSRPTAATEEYQVPQKTHRLWLTDNSSPKNVSDINVKNYLDSIRFLKGSNWEHNFWCIDPSQIQQTVSALQASGLGIKIRKIDELPALISGDVFKRLFDLKLFAFAADVLRKEIVYHCGGIYSDIGLRFQYDFTPVFKKFKFGIALRGNAFDVNVIAAQPGSSVLEHDLKFIGNLPHTPASFKAIRLPEIISHCWLSSYHFMVFLSNHAAEHNIPVFFCTEGLHMKVCGTGSWLSGLLVHNVNLFKDTR